VYGRLKDKKMTFTIQAACANSGREIEIAIDSNLTIHRVPDGSDPMVCVPIVSLAKTKEPGIVDLF
jgi:hypothetical protein